MSQLIAAQIAAFEDSTVILMARIEDVEKALIVPASVAGITLRVTELGALGNFTEPAVDENTQVLDPPVNDAKWTIDAIGYNFIHTLVPADISKGGKTYLAEFTFTDSVGAVSQIVFKVDTENLLKSV